MNVSTTNPLCFAPTTLLGVLLCCLSACGVTSEGGDSSASSNLAPDSSVEDQDTGTNDTYMASDTDLADTTAPDTAYPETCEVLLAVEVRGLSAYAVMTNLTDQVLKVTVAEQCPHGNAVWSGAEEPYDYYHACLRGGCQPGTPPTFSYELGPFASLDVPGGHIPLRFEDNDCNSLIESGTTLSLSFSLPLEGDNPEFCGPEELLFMVP